MPKQRWGEFCSVFGASSRNRIIELFLEGRDIDFPAGYVAEETGLTRATAYNIINRLGKEGYLIPSRRVSGIQFFKLNKQKPETKLLIVAFNIVLDGIAKKYAVKKKVLCR